MHPFASQINPGQPTHHLGDNVGEVDQVRLPRSESVVWGVAFGFWEIAIVGSSLVEEGQTLKAAYRRKVTRHGEKAGHRGAIL